MPIVTEERKPRKRSRGVVVGVLIVFLTLLLAPVIVSLSRPVEFKVGAYLVYFGAYKPTDWQVFLSWSYGFRGHNWRVRGRGWCYGAGWVHKRWYLWLTSPPD